MSEENNKKKKAEKQEGEKENKIKILMEDEGKFIETKISKEALFKRGILFFYQKKQGE